MQIKDHVKNDNIKCLFRQIVRPYGVAERGLMVHSRSPWLAVTHSDKMGSTLVGIFPLRS